MEIERLIEPATDWMGGTWAARIDQAASLLFLHGYITQGQRTKITQKLEAQFRDGIELGRIISQGTNP